MNVFSVNFKHLRSGARKLVIAYVHASRLEGLMERRKLCPGGRGQARPPGSFGDFSAIPGICTFVAASLNLNVHLCTKNLAISHRHRQKAAKHFAG